MSKLPTLAPQNMTEAMEFSKMISQSGMVPGAYKGKPQDVLVAIQWGYELGLQPLQALQNIAVINGKPSVYGDAALALVKNDPRCAGVKEWIDGEGDNKVAHCLVKRRYAEEMEETERTFSVADAKKARLWGKQGPWTNYAERMLAMRARGFALRDAFPDALKGVITAEEAQDYPVDKGEARDITPSVTHANPLDSLPPPPPADDYAEYESTTIEVAAEVIPEPVPEPVPEPRSKKKSKPSVYQVMNHNGEQYKDDYTTEQAYADGFTVMLDVYEKNFQKKGTEAAEALAMLFQIRDHNLSTMGFLEATTRVHVSGYLNTKISRLEKEASK